MSKADDALIDNLSVFTGFARARLGDPELAADVVQESLLKALRSAEKPADSEGAVVWFYRILRHTIIDLHRRRDVRDRALERLEIELAAAPSAEDARLICQCFKNLMPTLPARDQAVIQRVDLDGTAPKAVAEELGLSVSHLNVRLHRARKRLRVKLEDTCCLCSKHGCLDCSCDRAEVVG